MTSKWVSLSRQLSENVTVVTRIHRKHPIETRVKNMATIYYGIAGEGRGHATRARAIIEGLRELGHRVVVYTSGYAHHLLLPLYRDTDVEIRCLPGLSFAYAGGKRLSLVQTFADSMPYLRSLPELKRRILAEMEHDPPDLVVTDFEPALPRAARAGGVPFVSIDHQNFLTTYDLSSLPTRLRTYAAFLSPWVRAFYPRGALATIVSSFFFPPLRPAKRVLGQVGVLLRPEVVSTPPVAGEHLVVYLRRFASQNLLESLATSGCPVRVYGLGRRQSWKNITFCDVDPFRFVEDLATSRALVCTAGNQLVGEALYFKKPVFAMPETGNYEQAINAHFIGADGVGQSASLERVQPEDLRFFLNNLDRYRDNIDPVRVHGNPATLSYLDACVHHALERRSPQGVFKTPAFALPLVAEPARASAMASVAWRVMESTQRLNDTTLPAAGSSASSEQPAA